MCFECMMRQQNVENHPTMARDLEEKTFSVFAETHSASSLAPVLLFPAAVVVKVKHT